MSKDNLFTCVSQFAVELAKQPIQSAFACVLLLLFFTAGESEKKQILDTLLNFLDSPNSILFTIFLFILLLFSLYFNAILFYKNYKLKQKIGDV